MTFDDFENKLQASVKFHRMAMKVIDLTFYAKVLVVLAFVNLALTLACVFHH